MTQIASQIASDVTGGALVFLDKALVRIKKFNIAFTEDAQASAPIVALIEKIAHVDPAKAVAIARVIAAGSAFNNLVRSQVAGSNLSDRYEQMSQAFDSIREDAKMMVTQLEDGKISLAEKAQNTWMRIARGTISDRFDKVRSIYLQVAEDSKIQIERENAILHAYEDFRMALKEGQILALQLLQECTAAWDRAKEDLISYQQNIAHAGEQNAQDAAKAQLQHDQIAQRVRITEEQYQIAKDLADNLQVGYATGQVVMARLAQTSKVKERVYQQAVSFFSTNESVLAALNASFTGLAGLHESTQTLNQMKSGIEKSLETLAEVGSSVQMEGIKAGYGPTISAAPVQKLLDAIITFQTDSMKAIADLREESTKNAAQINQAVLDAQERYVKLLEHQ